MFARNLKNPREADPELARKSLASLGILYLLGYVGFGNQQALILVETAFNSGGLLQLRVLRRGFLQDGDIGVGISPEGEKIFVSSECPDAGGIGIRALRGSRLQGIGTSHSQMR
jgi:hypothetical protein